jgi:hypothetical protein
MAETIYVHPIGGCSLSSTYTSTNRVVRIILPPGSIQSNPGGEIRLVFGYRGTTYRRMFEKVYFGRADPEYDPSYIFDGSQVQLFFGGSASINEYSGNIITTDSFVFPIDENDTHILSIETGATTNYIPYQYNALAYGHRFYAGTTSANTAGEDGFIHDYSSSDRWPALICQVLSLNVLKKDVAVVRAVGFDLCGRSEDEPNALFGNVPETTLEVEVSYANMAGSVPFPTINATGWDADYAPTMEGKTPTLSLEAVCGMFSQGEWLTPLPKLEARSGHRMSLDKNVVLPRLQAKMGVNGSLDKKVPFPTLSAYGQTEIFGSLEKDIPTLSLSARAGLSLSGKTPILRLSATGKLDSRVMTLEKTVPVPTLEAFGAGRFLNLNKEVPVPTLSAFGSRTSFNAELSRPVPVPRISATMSRETYNSLDKELPLPRISASGGILEPGRLEGYLPVPYIQAAMLGEDHGFCDYVLRYER